MKIYVKASKSNIPTLQEYLFEVDTRDTDIIQQLMNIKTFNGKLFSAPSSRNELGRTQNYGPEDKVIHMIESQDDYRIYSIPFTSTKYPGVTGIFTFELTCYDDGSFKFGDGKIRKFGEVSDNTLSNDVGKARMKIYVKASEAPIDYMQIILDQKSNTGAGVDDSKAHDLIQEGSGLNAVAFKIFLKIRDAENFKSPFKYTRNDCEAALERLMSVENLNGRNIGVIYRGLKGNLIKRIFSRIYLGDYGNPKKLASILCDILQDQGFSYVDFDRMRGYHSEWVIEFGTEEDLGSMNDYLEQHPDMARRFSWGTLYLDKEEL